jgi:hypothetical protein
LRGIVVAALTLVGAGSARAQGGPPLLTDDPGTVAKGRWEINLAFTLERQDSGWHDEAPLLDVNYGWSERLQLKLEAPWVVEDESGSNTRSALGEVRFGAKWRFAGSETGPQAVSTYPQITLDNSALGGSGVNGAELLLPVEYARVVGPIGINAELGIGLRTGGGPSDWLYGLAVGYDAATQWQLLAEIHGLWTPAARTTELVFDLGTLWKVTLGQTLLIALGRSLPGSTNRNPRFLGYVGLQLHL